FGVTEGLGQVRPEGSTGPGQRHRGSSRLHRRAHVLRGRPGLPLEGAERRGSADARGEQHRDRDDHDQAHRDARRPSGRHAPTLVTIRSGIAATDTMIETARYAVASAFVTLEFVFCPRYPGSLATTRIGKKVRGIAAAESTSTNSVTLTGSTVVPAAAAATTMHASTVRWTREASFGLTYLPHCQPRYWASV